MDERLRILKMVEDRYDNRGAGGRAYESDGSRGGADDSCCAQKL